MKVLTSSKTKSSTPKQLKAAQAAIVGFNRKYARMKLLERKQDTRQKIQWGGLIKKAGLEAESTAVLFGLFLEAAEMLKSEKGETMRADWRLKGDLALTADEQLRKEG